jgi:hypothetical protein
LKKTPELVEEVKTLHAMGWHRLRLAKEFGVDERTIRYWLAVEDEPDQATKLEELRLARRLQAADKAWDVAEGALAILQKKIDNGEMELEPAKHIATIFGITVDKIMALEARGSKTPGRGSININILPPTDGHTTRVIADPIQVHDESRPIQRDDSGSGVGEDVLRLPQSGYDCDGESWEPGDDSSE